MALHKPVTYGDIDFTGLYKARTQPTVQRISDRSLGFRFDTQYLKDFDILDSVYGAKFFALPYVVRQVEADEPGRPDLISYRVYSDTDFWSFILLFNRIADPMSGYKVGFDMKIPQYQPLASWLTRNLIQRNINNR